ncbi:uncharacterized protein STEHIDRAFT_156106 [Stereum hirsutum FP-91666 SS1]|uniref:uncharacterized protein n=1 Tax=Stereum hirsutum (strain FP-91666) TaxID=721885 RepID=UPI000440ACCA|nr:uncharacterized protein STEHIDRAFT_156106 [Stereum hirsutum FP-91666 SS1]EIM87115.1 hypothetical protein STEHIDRAFT_156106 [Stereum hirsutum FP-91666 SS1]
MLLFGTITPAYAGPPTYTDYTRPATDILDALQCPFGPHNTAIAPPVSSSSAASSTAKASAGSRTRVAFENVLLLFLGTSLSVFVW